MLEVKDLNYKYKNGEMVLENINFNVRDGEVVAIIRKKWFRKIYFGKIACRYYNSNIRKNYSSGDWYRG